MRKLFIILFLFISLIANAVTYYVATTGSDGYVGDIDHPWASWQKAFTTADVGDTVFFRGGVYLSTAVNKINPTTGFGHSGTYSNPIVFMSYPGEWAILDCFYQCSGDIPEYNQAINILYTENIHFKDFEVRNVFQCDSVLSGAISATYSRNLTFEHIIVHQVAERAFYIQGGAWKSYYDEGNTAQVPYWDTPYDTTRFINCDVYDLCDTLSSRIYPKPGNNADGWKTTHYKGNYVSWENCRIWNYSDDAIDPTPGNGSYLVFDGNWIMSSKKYDSFENMEGNGIKVAAYSELLTTDVPMGETIIQNNIAMYCAAIGINNNLFVNNNGTQPQNKAKIYNNTVFHSGTGFYEWSFLNMHDSTIFKNNLGYNNDLYYGDPNDFYGSNILSLTERNNTSDWIGGWPGWELTDTVTVTDTDFIETDSTALVALFTASRQADGSLPSDKPLQLTIGSDLIDAGVDIGSAYNGTAPDIGYAEYGVADSTKTYITAFSFSEQMGVAIIDTSAHTVDIEVEYGTDVTDLTATFSLSTGATAKIGATSQTSGVTENDFTDPVIYAVTALDGVTSTNYTITVTVDTEPVATVVTSSADTRSVLAYVSGNVIDDGGGTLTAQGICYSTSESPTVADSKIYFTPAVGSYTCTLKWLISNTTYHARAFATTSEGGTTYGSDVEFTTTVYSIDKSRTGLTVKGRDSKIIVIK